jgi:hypothetical protein
LYLQSTSTQQADGNWTAVPTSSVLNLGVSSVNQTSDNYISYCWHSVAGYSSFGSFSGTGASGNAVTGLGFKPAFLMVKGIDVAEHWVMFDNTRSPTNSVDQYLLANTSGAEATNQSARAVDFDADGFTVNGTSTEVNQSGKNYLYMAFADTREAAFWKDVSGQGNHWTPNNLDYRDSLLDSPANNFATLNPLFTNGGTTQNFKEGNLQFTADSNYALAHGTFAMRSGKWYWETYIKSWVSVPAVGISRGTNTGGNSYVGYDPNGNVKSFGYESGGIIYGASGVGTSAGSQLASGQTTYTTGDIIGCSFDADAGELKFYKNGTLVYTVSSIDEFDWMPATSAYNGGVNIVNFGQDSTFAGATTAGGNTDANGIGDFKHPVPSGFLALATSNLPEPTIVDGSEHFNTLLWSGNSTDNRDITGIGFDADFTWLKARSNGNSHGLADTVRGNIAPNMLSSNSTNAEFDWTGIFKGHITDGFTVGTDSAINYSGETYVAWNWKAGGAAVSNTDGSVTSQVSANVDAGFSIVGWTGSGAAATVGHGLGVEPSMIIVKNRIDARNWSVWHKDLSSNDYYLRLDSTTAQASAGANYWNSTAPTSSVFSVGNEGDVNDSGDGMIAYCFANSDTTKVGSYTGNGSSDGPFIFTGGRVQWLMIKRSDSAGNWYMWDDVRHLGNDVDNVLYADLSNAESVGSSYGVDFLSNGFKVRHSGTDINASGGTFIYLAIMEPFKFSLAR